jgi:carbon monoxide dehydrogenase subunit G
MQFTNEFDVSLPPAQAWPVLMDIERIVPCMPGAELVEIIDEKTFKGKVAVKLGPVALVFVCNAVFEEVDNDAHKARIKAAGSDSKGRGNANTLINFRLQPSAKGSRVIIDTDLTLSGAVAQYGRGVGMIQTVANQIISQFSRNLEAQISASRTEEAAAGPAVGATSAAGAPAQDGVAPAAAPAARRPPPPPAKPISGFSLILSSLWAMVRGWFGGSRR